MPFPFAAAAGLLGAGLNFFTQRDNSERASEMARYNTDAQIKAQKEMADTAYIRNLEQWNRENAYNDPQAMMARLKGAGLNPMMAYGSGSLAANSAANGASAPTYNPQYSYQASATPQIDPMGLMASVQQLSMGKAQINKVKEETAILQQEKIIRSVDALMATLNEENVPKIVQAALKKLLSDSDSAEADSKLKTGSLEHDLNYRKALAAGATTDAQRKAREFKDLFPIDKDKPSISELQRALMQIQKETGDVDLKMLKELGIDPKAPAWMKIIGRNLDKLPKWLTEYFTN